MPIVTGSGAGGVSITAITDSAYPPRVIVEGAGLTVGDVVTLWRDVGGVRTAVRGGFEVVVTDTVLLRIDAEFPFGTPIRWYLDIDGSDVAHTDPLTVALPGGKVALSDAITGLAVETVISAWPDKPNPRTASTYVVGGRNIVVLEPRGGFSGDVEFLTETQTAWQQMIDLLNNCTTGLILVRQPGGYFGVDGVYAVLADTESRVAQSGQLARRLWTLSLVSTDTWPAQFVAAGWTLQDIANAYTGHTLADLAADFSTLLDIAIFDWGLV